MADSSDSSDSGSSKYKQEIKEQTSSQYDQESKKECRSKLIEHAVRCLTTERSKSVCVKRDHVEGVWKQLLDSGETKYFTEKQREEIQTQIHDWED